MNQLLAANWQEDYGPYALWQAVDSALHDSGYESQRVVIIYTQTTDHQPLLETNSLFVPPSQAVDVAVGLITANPALKVIVSMTTNDLYGPLWPSILPAANDNHNITILTQQSIANPSVANTSLQTILTSADCWVGRSIVSDPRQTSHLLQQALKHDGLSILEVIVPLSNQQQSSYQAIRSRVSELQPSASNRQSWPTNDKSKAWHLLSQAGERLDLGLVYAGITPSYQKRLLKKIDKPLVDRSLKIELKKLWDTFDS